MEPLREPEALAEADVFIEVRETAYLRIVAGRVAESAGRLRRKRRRVQIQLFIRIESPRVSRGQIVSGNVGAVDAVENRHRRIGGYGKRISAGIHLDCRDPPPAKSLRGDTVREPPFPLAKRQFVDRIQLHRM